MADKKINYSPKSVEAVIVEQVENPLVYTIDEETGAVSESYEGYGLRTIEDGEQNLHNVKEINGVIDNETGAEEVVISAWGPVRIVRRAGSGNVLELVDTGETLAVQSGSSAWRIIAQKPVEISYTGSANLRQSLANIITYDNVAFDANREAVLSATVDEFELMADPTKEVLVILDDVDSFEWTLRRVSVSSGNVAVFSGCIQGQMVIATFTSDGSAVVAGAKIIDIAEGNVELEQGETYAELASVRLNGRTYTVLTSAEATQIAEQHGYTPTFATNAEIDMLFVSNTLNKNSWELIGAVIDANQAANYWAIGDTKTDVGTDNQARTMRICDMSGMYGKKVVFEQVELENTNYVWQSTAIDGYYNNYSTSEMRTVHLPAILAKYSSDLQSFITNTTYKVATNGNDGTLLELTDKLFLPAEKELYGSSANYCRSEEAAALTQFQYYATHSSNADHIKYKPGQTSGYYWWQRSPYSGGTSRVCFVDSNGSRVNNGANGSFGVAPCFAR